MVVYKYILYTLKNASFTVCLYYRICDVGQHAHRGVAGRCYRENTPRREAGWGEAGAATSSNERRGRVLVARATVGRPPKKHPRASRHWWPVYHSPPLCLYCHLSTCVISSYTVISTCLPQSPSVSILSSIYLCHIYLSSLIFILYLYYIYIILIII